MSAPNWKLIEMRQVIADALADYSGNPDADPDCWLPEANAVAWALIRSASSESAVKWLDMFGAAPDFTGGQDVNEFLDEQRGAP